LAKSLKIAYGPDAASRHLHGTAWRELPESPYKRDMFSGSFDSPSLLTSFVLAQDGQNLKVWPVDRACIGLGISVPEGKYAARFRNFGRRKFKVR
jgi:hypothetical protein